MTDDRMFSQLMESQAPPVARTEAPQRARRRHVTWNLTERHVGIIDRYFTLLYQSEPRPTKSEIVGLAIDILDRILGGTAPDRLDADLLDEYTRRQPARQAAAQQTARAAVHTDDINR